MTRRYSPAALIAFVAFVAFVAVLAPAAPVNADGGSDSDVTSDYRTRITDVTDIDGLSARIIDIDGSVELTWSGAGAVVVFGYEGEPYLRIDPTGVARNLRSPATYLNQDRYARVALPDTTDADAPPDWQLVTSAHRYSWHDHRTHWMSTTPPLQVQQADDRSQVIFDRWEIPLTVDDTAAVIAGDLTWSPPPSMPAWLAAAAIIAAAAGVMLWSRVWQLAAALLAAIGTIAITVDTVGFVAEMNGTLAGGAGAYLSSALAAGALIRLGVHARRRTPDPTLAMFAAGVILTVMGGLDRFDVLTAGYYQSALPVTVARATTVLSLGIGIALTTRFLAFLVPLLTRRGDTPTPSAQEPATT